MTDKFHHSISQRSSREPSPHRGDNLFSDENTIESLGVADGFQPTFNLQNMPLASRRETSRSSNLRDATSPPREKKRKASLTQGTTKSFPDRNSFSLQNDAQYSDNTRRIPSVSSATEQNEGLAARASSFLSRQSTFGRPQSTYDGPSAPSHPYGMYPQNSTEMAHRASVASSNRPTRERSYHGRDRPTHPYAMYPQNTVPESETDPLNTSADIASVGFPGLNIPYARRLGPDGEEADDIIGPDGHTEQLPPYSQYAEARPVPPKRQTRLAPLPLSPIPQEPSNIPNSATSLSDTLLSPTAYNSTAALAHDDSSMRQSKEHWSEKSRRRTCFGRIPLWGVALIIIIIIAMSAVLGGVIGRVLARQRANGGRASSTTQPDYASATSTTPTASDTSIPSIGAIPLPTPYTGPLAAAPTGTYNLLINSPAENSSTCLEPNQELAWNCMGPSTDMQISVQNPMTSAATVELTGPAPGTTPLLYGDQYPVIQGRIVASYNLDPEDKDSGATLYFHATYPKQVLLRYNEITASPTKRSVESGQMFERREVHTRVIQRVLDQALLWSCIWPDTDIDGYIYVNVPTGGNTATTSSASAVSPTPTSPSRRSASGAKKGQTPINLYPRKIRFIEYRHEATELPSCALMQFSNGTLVAPPNPPNGPTSIVLQESKPPSSKSGRVPYWRHDELSSFGIRDSTTNNFCFCEWIIA